MVSPGSLFLGGGANNPVNDPPFAAVPGNALSPDVHRDHIDEFENRAGLGKTHPVDLGRVVAREVEITVRSPGAAGVAHFLESVQDGFGKHPGFEILEVGAELDHLGRHLVAIGRLTRTERSVVVGKGHPPVAVVEVDPGEGSPVYTETVISDMLHRVGVPDFDRARHRPLVVIRVGAVDLPVQQHRAVEVNDRPIFFPLPLLDKPAGLLLVFCNFLVVDGVKVPVVDPHTLIGLGDNKLADLLQAGCGHNHGGVDQKQECRNSEGQSHSHGGILRSLKDVNPV